MLKKALLCAVCAMSSFQVFAQPTVPEFKNIGLAPTPPIAELVNITPDGYVIGDAWFEYCTSVTCYNDGSILTVRDSNMNLVLSLTFQREILQNEKSIIDIESAVIDGDNNLIVAGKFMSDMNFAPNDAVAVNRHGGAASGMWSGFLAKYRLSDGHLYWVNTMDAAGIASVGGAYLATDEKKNIFMYLAKGGNVDIDPGPASLIINKGVLAKYNTNGNYLAHIAAEQSYGGIYTPFKMIDKKLYLLSIADSVYPNKQTFVFQEYDPENMKVTRSKKIGAFKMSGNWPGRMHVKYTLDKSGNIWLLSSYTESCSIGSYNKTLVTAQNGTEKEQLLIKLDNNLNVTNVWPVHKTVNSATYAANFGIDSLGNVLIIGTMRDSIDIDLSAGTQYLKTVFPPPYLSGNWGTMYFNCYDKNMNLLWSKTMGDTSLLWGYNIEFGHRKNIYVLGHARGTINFDLLGNNFATTPPNNQPLPMGLTEMYARYKWNTAAYTTDVPKVSTRRLNISIYPNPANSVLNVDLGEMPGKQTSLTVTDINGRTLWSTDTRNAQTVEVPVEALPPATYLLSIDVEGHPKETRQFVKQ